jgi:N-formylglutamate deformylase
VKAYSEPRRRRHSLQVEVNKRLYMDEATRSRHPGFAVLQADLSRLAEAIADYIGAELRRG